jgi:predicted glutamine amidotransferase
MCRLLGLVSRTQAPLGTHLALELKPFAALSSHHCDGWGMACWDEHENLVVDRAPEQAMPSTRFWAATESRVTNAALLHLRKASVGMATTTDNTHPFTIGSVAFAHNGYFAPSDVLDDLLSDRGARPALGGTDSERYFHLVLAAMREEGPVVALRSSAELIIAKSQEVTSLNCLMLTGDALYALAWAPAKSSPAIEATGGTYEMLVRRTDDAVVLASDGWQSPGEDWEPIPNGAVIEVSRADMRLTVHQGQIGS